MEIVPAHQQKFTHRYMVVYPDHQPRESDPHYKDFHAYRRKHVDTAKCQFSVDRGGDESECDLQHPLELHHAFIEYALLGNLRDIDGDGDIDLDPSSSVDLALIAADFPGIDTPEEVGEWINSADNLIFLCRKHHRGAGGVHSAAYSSYVASQYVRNMILPVEK